MTEEQQRHRVRSLSWRLLLCAILLGWVCQAIFLKEASEAYQRQGGDWDALARADQWRLAWVHGPRGLWQTLRLIQPAAGAASLAFMGGTILVGALRWRKVMHVQGIDLSRGRALSISFVAHFFNSFLLGSTGGDLVKALYAARLTHHRKTEAVVAVAVDRLIGLLSMLLFATVMLLPNWSLVAAHRRLGALSGLVVLMLLGGLAVATLSFWGGLSRRWPGARQWLRSLPKSDMIERSLEASRRFGREPRVLAETLALSMLINVLCVLQVWALARGLGIEIAATALFLIVPVIICISALPITPSGLGLRENIYVWMLAVPEIHVAATQALSLSLLAYAGSLAWSMVGGLVYLGFRERASLTRPDPEAESPSA
ncbi:MAG TPA: lysylphosphatidylglycerol synthase transmembrane domain-containing protein [Verrucomicrobiota bacterium]|nr:lysylphosphatidylglycerol synthase transmembrane domain-containing protein [Verrucomicrobiota bacterium]HNU49429.1 lysylphosphatidylglycerol synthase transmembrane domain-containing protein [Verrucomicrobiota bacterium]